MRLLKLATTVLILYAIVFLSLSCSSSSSSTSTVKTTITNVQKGSISVAVIGTGSLALQSKQVLSFGQTGIASNVQNSKISEVDVKAGQTVEKDTVLVKADPKDWQDQITSDQHQLDAAKAALDQTQTALLQAQASLVSDQYKLSMQQDVADIQTKIDNANAQLQAAENMLIAASAQSGLDTNYWRTVIANTKTDITNYQKQMTDLLKDPAHYLAASSVNSSTASVAQINSLQTTLQQDQANIQQAQTNITLKQNALDDAQATLDDEKNSAHEIVAPFKGLITKVNVNQGDIVARNAALIEIAELDKFQASVLVTEKDVVSLKVGGEATVSLDALSGLSFPAKIIQIAPLATVSSGVVNYNVIVELTSITPKVTVSNAVGAAGTAGTTSLATSTSSGSAQNVVLKDGFSAAVNIVVQQKDNILLIPSKAITKQGQNYVVQVVKGTTTETRVVKTGIADSKNTEITEGLVEGDQVITTTTTSSTSTTNKSGGVAIPGMGGPGGGF
jgi:multidrug efflux pump subunit AcrA (membrane-fusion protein)